MHHYIDEYADELGPAKIVHLYDPVTQLKAIVVLDNLSLGPSIGGCRMAPDVTTREVFRLARAMTLKNAINFLPYGGGKSSILSDSKSPDKEKMIEVYAEMIRHLPEYIPGPDMGTDENSMAMIKDKIGRAVGLPASKGGLPLDELGTTGFGVAVAADVAAEKTGLHLKGARVTIQGFGNVGKAAAKLLIERGASIIAVSDSKGTLVNNSGLDLPTLLNAVDQGKKVAETGLGQAMDRDGIIEVETDIFVPAARPDVIHPDNQGRLKARLILEGANIPITHDAAAQLHARGVTIVPDVIANGGGVTCAVCELEGLSKEKMFDRIQNNITRNTQELLERVVSESAPPHEIADRMARERIRQAMKKK